MLGGNTLRWSGAGRVKPAKTCQKEDV